jgi:hypothetical protein
MAARQDHTSRLGARIALDSAELMVTSTLGRPVELLLQIRSLKWHGRTIEEPAPPATPTATGPLPLLSEFLEEQLWAARDRAEALEAVSLPEPLAVTLAVVTDRLTDAALLLRRPTRTARAHVSILLGQLRKMLETIERDAWPTPSPG